MADRLFQGPEIQNVDSAIQTRLQLHSSRYYQSVKSELNYRTHFQTFNGKPTVQLLFGQIS